MAEYGEWNRKGAIWGNPYLRILRSQLEKYIKKNLGKDHLLKNKHQDELRKIKKETALLNKKLKLLQEKKKELEDRA